MTLNSEPGVKHASAHRRSTQSWIPQWLDMTLSLGLTSLGGTHLGLSHNRRMDLGTPSNYYKAIPGLITVAYLANRTSDAIVCYAAKKAVVGGTRAVLFALRTTLAGLKPIAWKLCKGSVRLLKSVFECSNNLANRAPALLLAGGASYLAASHGTEWIDQYMVGPASRFLVRVGFHGLGGLAKNVLEKCWGALCEASQQQVNGRGN